MTNESNKGLSRDNMSWQQGNSDTSYVRAAADLKEAGINPILAGQFGGASTPASALATMQNPAAGISGTASNIAGIKKTKAETSKIELETALKRKDLPKAELQELIARKAITLMKDNISNKDMDSAAKTLGNAIRSVPNLYEHLKSKATSPNQKQIIDKAQEHALQWQREQNKWDGVRSDPAKVAK